ncbi:MAG: phage tail sheath C-terminal domain-containing protein [Pseudomonadota bacterium]
MAGNDNEWRYIPAIRIFNFVEKSIQKITAFVVFEPNAAITWLKLNTLIQNFLYNLWQQGTLAGKNLC